MPAMFIENSEYFEKEEEKVWNKDWNPECGEDYFFVDSFGDIESSLYYAARADNYRVKNGNCFKTEYEAEMWRKRLEALAVKQTAVKGKSFWCYNFQINAIDSYFSDNSFNYMAERKKFATEKDALEYGEKYRDCIMFFNK